MLSRGDDGTCVAGRYDVLFICKDLIHKKYYLTFYEEACFTDSAAQTGQRERIRLTSVFCYPLEANSFDDALFLLEELRRQLIIDDANVYTARAIPWQKLTGDTLIVANWRRQGSERTFEPAF